MSIPPELIINEKLKLDYSDDSHPSEMSSTEGNSNCLTSSSSENYLNDHRTIFLCGYVQGRWHNESLNNITNDLSSDFFVCTNKTKENFSFTLARDMLKNSKTFIFLLNEYTLNDLACLLCLQYAYEIHLPIVVLRPPKTQLIILNKKNVENPGKEDNGDDEENIRNRISNLKLDHQLDIKIISKILFEGYEKSISYDKLEHERSMIKIKKQLKMSIPITARRMSTRKVGVIDIPHQITLIRHYKKNKNFYSINNICGKMDRQGRTNIDESDMLIPIKRNPSKCRVTEKVKKRKSNIKGSSSLINLPMKCNENKNDNQEVKNNIYKSAKKNTSSSNISTTRSSDLTFSDRATFKNTRYLVFNGKDSSKKPYLINFPNDLITQDGEVIESEIYNQLKANSNIYGNDDSDFDADRDFDENEDKIRAEIAMKVKGTLNDDDLYNYEDDLEF
ncbi:Hypothetical protein SRAE_2000044300 [Strongyloides ratti]|uniref:Uncharacterized protein n=1 Tax=Strongyloides ratti TaxID=34506 RepID=A0A090L7R4_STRRB|nr:Hypothetical protein SRAE_2000044300 [Strongyloides ratti]CEF65767.1 Hypothetical protein SRAE_2000044300 [Strongyloides ratti]